MGSLILTLNRIMPSRRTKALAIPKSVKERVYQRDGGRCIICGDYGYPNAHYISRAGTISGSGLGIEQNVVTLCQSCHAKYDQSVFREEYGAMIRGYLKRKYPDWDENDLIYRKGM